jgi:heme-degrading monooxygenase HmoA
MIAKTPEPPYYAVYFISHRRQGDQGYADMAREMVELAARQPGFLGVESLRDPDGWGVTVSYWENEDAIKRWKAHTRHLKAQAEGKKQWYDTFHVRICRVEREYGFSLTEKE